MPLHQVVRSNVNRLGVVALHKAKYTFDAVIDETERTRLLSIAPNLETAVVGDHLTAKGGRRLLSSALPRSLRAVNVV